MLGDFANQFSDTQYWDYTHFNERMMTPKEIEETMPKVWVVGGDGGLGDIGFQNLSKVILQNRPNVKAIMLDTQVYSNTGGQNSDSSPMPGGFDMNQAGAGSQGKLTEKKGVAECFLGGHGSPFVAQVSMANSANLYRAIVDGLLYRGTCFIQSFTTCQPEHGVADAMSAKQAQYIRDSRGMPEFVFNPQLGETYPESFSVKGNPQPKKDWYEKKSGSGEKFKYTVANWAASEARFRRHIYKINPAEVDQMIFLEDILWRITQNDVVNRRYLLKDSRCFIPTDKVYTLVEANDGSLQPMGLSRQMVLFCVERRKSWRIMQSRAGIPNEDYAVQKQLLKNFDADKLDKDAFFGQGIRDLVEQTRAALKEK